ncbi:endonuclease MutS2 [Candidatus Palauibacter sp.]|uniref:endonuclease MutS2 n=1 Tax=Candidatus Palauibacter sp. TaxID=3101350 RepID=UPI003B012A67
MDHALRVIEFDRVLAAVGERAVSEAGRTAVRGLRPLPDAASAGRSLAAVHELRELLGSGDGWVLDPIAPLDGALRRLAIEDAALEPPQLLACGQVMAVARAVRRLEARLDPDGLPAEHVSRLWGEAALEKRIARTFDATGGVADGASPELRRLRRALATRRGRLVDELTRYARSLPERVRVPDGSVTVRNGRYCIPVRREGKGIAGGLVHDASASRRTLFVEPSRAIEAMNEIRELELREAREVDRILRDLSSAVRARAPDLATSYAALVELDSLRARALFAGEMDASPPAFVEAASEGIHIRGARHPLLALDAGGAVPFDLDLSAGERVLLVSGPNAGGKTVFLKTLGLLSALSQSGVLPPLGGGSRIPFFRRFFAVIGDEQSIEASLSTFGAQARNLAEILDEAGDRDLVLFDEIGSATDPAEGGALAAASLGRLARQARLTVATTHLGDLKRLGDEKAAAVNASLEFDGTRLEPTYRLVRDRPGRSYALIIAARLGVPEDVLADARDRLGPEHVSLDTLLARLEADRGEVEDLRAQLERRAGKTAERERDLASRETALADSERAAARSREAERLAALREARERVEAAISRLEAEFATGDEARRREAKRAARGEVERALRASSRAVRALGESTPPSAAPTVRAGDAVRWNASDRPARLVEIREDRGLIEVGELRLTVPLRDLTPHSAPETRSSTRPSRSAGVREAGRSSPSRPDFRIATEIDLRGLRVDEVEGTLNPAVDAAVVGDLPWLRVIHGKGTGALRERVGQLLAADPRIRLFRTGESNEGGTGVTVVEFD